MKKLITLLLLCFALIKAHAQRAEPLTIDTCYARAVLNYPLVKQRELIEKTKEYSISNAAKGSLPSITLNGQQSYQSDVTKVPAIGGPDITIPTLSKNQYKIYTDIETPLYQGGAVKHEKQLHEANGTIEAQKLEVELYKLKERVNQLFFGTLLLEGQLDQNNLLREDLELGLKKTKAAVANGIALKSSEDALQAELLKTTQRAIELSETRKGYLDVLGMLIGEVLDEHTILEKPQSSATKTEINRPELALFDYQYKAIDIQNKMLTGKNQPRLSSFLQVGYGKPGLNMLNNQADSYYIGGLRLNWTISRFYTLKKERELLDIRRNNINLEKETFLFNTQYTMRQQNAELVKLQRLLATDNEIITLRNRVKTTASVQLENGVIDINDYLSEVNAEDQARQNKLLHEVQYLMAEYALQTTAGI